MRKVIIRSRESLKDESFKDVEERITEFTYGRKADVVIEAIVENLEIKQKLFKAIEGKLKPGAILATNTSSIVLEDIAEPLADPGRLIGLHFFNPVAQLPLVEVIRGIATSDEVTEAIVHACEAMGKNRVGSPCPAVKIATRSIKSCWAIWAS